ncbi:unnamed protein product, partial [Onchocerca ochengi]|uniref:ATPase_AAA_core domain-containing protein n=1 Tax=Onchocerca ochengi TaxID=42157 RepID=A0A182EK39_ONCOC
DINDNKENTNLNKPNDKENNDVQQCNNASIGVRPLYPSLLVVPRAGPKAKVKKWLEDIPNQWDHLVDREEDALTFCQQDQIDSGSTVQPDSLLMKKLSSYRTSFGGLPKKQDRKDKCRRRSLCLQKKIIELPTSSRRQTIIVGEVKKNMNEEINPFLGFTSTENANRSRCSASRNTDEIADDIVLIDDQGLNKSVPEKSSIFYKKKSHTSARQTTTNKSEIAINNSSICNDQLIDEETNYISKHEKKPVLMDEMDFAPFPSISNVGYAEIASSDYDLPCGFRQHQISKMISYNNNMFQMSLRQNNSDEYESLKEKIVIADSRILLRPRSARKKWSRNGKWESITEELQQNIWSEALRPVGTDELIADSTIVHKLCDWIGMWKERLQKSRSHKTDVRIANRQKRRDSDSFDSFNSDEEGEQLCNTAIIYGHCGSGKTSLIYAVSKRYEMHVLEIASNEKRNGLQLKCKLQGATHSHKCDVIYDKHDDGFWPALRTLCKEAHTPVIIVCEDISLVQKQLGLELPVVIFPLIRPEVQIVSSHLQELCATLNISVCSDICYALAEQYNGDLRACINHLQFYSGEGSDNSLRTLMKQSKSEKQIEIEALPKKCHFVSYNVILRNDHSYEPGAVLSSTDREEEVKVVENDMHVAVKVTRSALPAIEYFPLLDVILDYIPYLCIMNKASRAKMPTSRRALHYFDELHSDSQIDSSGALKNVLTQYYLLIH